MSRRLVTAFAVLLLALAAPMARADWPETGLPVGAGAGTQTLAGIVSDDLGGVYVAWGDAGAGLRVTRLSATGATAPGWPANGHLLTGGTYLGAAPDGANGIMLLFVGPPVYDDPIGMRRRPFYAVRFDAAGATPAGWSAAGNVVRTEQYPMMDDLGWEQVEVTHALPWSAGGSAFFLRWYRDPGNAGCHAIAVPAGGTAPTAWEFSLGPAGGNSYAVDRDSTGGFLVVRTAMDAMSARRYSAVGELLYDRPIYSGFLAAAYGFTLWPRQDAFVWWSDFDFPVPSHSRLGNDLLAVAGWPGTYVTIPMTPLVADGQGGIFARVDVSGTNRVDRLSLATSSPLSLWSPAPLPLDHAGRYVSDAQAGYFEMWMPGGFGSTLRAVHVGGDGALRTPWPEAGVVLTATHQVSGSSPRIVAGGAGVAYAAWEDTRSGDRDVYVQRLADDAPVPAQASLAFAEGFVDRVELEWFVEGALAAPTVERRSAAGAWSRLGEAAEVARDRWRHQDRDVSPGESFEYRLTENGVPLAGSTAFVRIPRAVTFALRGFVGNPATRASEVEFGLSGGAAARLELLDVAGRVLASEDVTRFGAGTHRVRLAAAAAVAPGVVFVRLREGARVSTSRAAFLR